MLGAVLNKVDTKKAGYGNYYGNYYGKYYGKYYGNYVSDSMPSADAERGGSVKQR